MSNKPFDSKLDDWAEAELEFFDPRTNSNFKGSIKTSWCGGFPFPFSIEGENGTMDVSKHLFNYEPCIHTNDDKELWFDFIKDQWEPHNQYHREVQTFCDKILHNQQSDTSAEYALRLQEVISMHYFSKLMGRTVKVEEMEKWANEVAAKAGDEQKAIEEIALKLCGAVEQVK
jgi:predicted dehydrogenase